MMTTCTRRWGARATIAAVLVLSAPLLLPNESWAQGNPAGETASPQEDDGIDSNLVPLEPELEPESTASSPSLPSTEGTAERPEQGLLETIPMAPGAPSADSQGPLYNIPVVIDPTVQSHIRFFNISIRNRFEQWLLRFSRYRPMVENIFAEFNLPSDLVNLSLVESGFNPYAYSRAKATSPS